MIEDRY